MDALLAHCITAFSEHGSLFVVFFFGGLTGSITHCLAMCGPVVACQATCAKSSSCGSRLESASQWSYHAGRLLTYGALGFVVAYFAQHVSAFSFWKPLSSGLLVLAGAMFIYSSLPRKVRVHMPLSTSQRFMRGMLMGFMPCGLLYGALMMAATLASPLSGMVAMWLFVLGTLPVLVLASAGADMLSQKWNLTMRTAGRAMMACNGLSLLLIAANTMR